MENVMDKYAGLGQWLNDLTSKPAPAMARIAKRPTAESAFMEMLQRRSVPKLQYLKVNPNLKPDRLLGGKLVSKVASADKQKEIAGKK